MKSIPGTVILQGDFMQLSTQEKIRSELYLISRKAKADVILSDMMSNTTGNSLRDHYNSIELGTSVIDFCKDHLNSGCSLVIKYFRGADDQELLSLARNMFKQVANFKPSSSRSESREIYLVARGKKSSS